MLQIRTIGGYGEVGKNCTAIKVDDEVVLLDLGLKMDAYVDYTQDEDYVEISGKKLMDCGAAPNISLLGEWRKQVKAILLGHAHLDHIGAIPYLGKKFKVDIYGTPFTLAVLKSILKDQKIDLKNNFFEQNPNSRFKISKKITAEFINMTHSTPQTVSILLHTPYGKILYANDFKLDKNPVLGQPFSQKKLESISPDLLIVDSLYADKEARTSSESVARQMLLDLFSSSDFANKVVFISTFSSHLARLKTIVECAKKLKRKIVFLGRSLFKYVEAGKQVGIGQSFEGIQIVKYGKKIRNFLLGVKKPEEYLFVVTGHQGEPKAVLSKLINYFPFQTEDVIIFSCTVIPTPVTIKNRQELESRIKEKKLRIYKDVHVSGHGAKEDIRDLVKMVNPKKIMSSHSEEPQMEELKKLAEDLGYSDDKIFLLGNGETLDLG